MLHFVLETAILKNSKILSLIVTATDNWQSDPDNKVFCEKFTILFKKTDSEIDGLFIRKNPALYWAAKHNHLLMVKTFISLGARHDIKDSHGKTATMYALDLKEKMLAEFKATTSLTIDPSMINEISNAHHKVLQINDQILEALNNAKLKDAHNNS